MQSVTNKIRAKEPKVLGKMIDGYFGSGIFGISLGLVASDFKNPNTGAYLGIGDLLGAASFVLGLVLDLIAEDKGFSRLLKK